MIGFSSLQDWPAGETQISNLLISFILTEIGVGGIRAPLAIAGVGGEKGKRLQKETGPGTYQLFLGSEHWHPKGPSQAQQKLKGRREGPLPLPSAGRKGEQGTQ